jgi:hypothetical protein
VAIRAGVVTDNWGNLFDSGGDSNKQRSEEPIIADTWGGFFDGEDAAANTEFADHWDISSSNPDATAYVTPEVAVESATHAVPNANYMEAHTTCSTPALTEHTMAEAVHRRTLRVPHREPLPPLLHAFPAHEWLDLSACASLSDASLVFGPATTAT